MTETAHPSEYIVDEVASIIRNSAAKAELQGSLCQEQLDVIYAQNWFNLFVPKAMGGLELSLPEALLVEEALAWADGSTGWTVTLCAGANWFAGFINQETAEVIFNNKKVCLAGSGQPSGIAKMKRSGFEISGRWKYATGAPHATAFTANCHVEEHGVILRNSDGSPLIQSFIFMRDEAVIHADWHTAGMIATASHSFEVNNLAVPASRRFVIDAGHAVLKNPLYQYPFLQFAETTLAVNMAGMAARFIALAEAAFAKRMQQKSFEASTIQIAEQKFNKAKRQITAVRQQFYAAVQSSWQACVSCAVINLILLDEVSAVSRLLATISLQLVDELYPLCGTAAATPTTEINRVWRNMHTASQHILLMPV